jgi:hypothetical protein
MALRQPAEPNSEPVETEMKDGFSKLDAIRALHMAALDLFTAASWAELGIVVGQLPTVTHHRRLLRALQWKDSDYEDAAKEVLLKLVGPNFEHLERFPSDMNRDFQRGGKGGVLASDSACEANHGQTLFTGLTGTCDRSG